MKLRMDQKIWVLISAYGPGSERGVEEREGFWDSLEGCIASFDDVNVVLLGDLTARVGDRWSGRLLWDAWGE